MRAGMNRERENQKKKKKRKGKREKKQKRKKVVNRRDWEKIWFCMVIDGPAVCL